MAEKTKLETVQVVEGGKITSKQVKVSITNQYLELKSMVDSEKFDVEAFDQWSMSLINYLGELSLHGITKIEGLNMNLWKDRVWFLIEKAGLLPEYREPNPDLELEETIDLWYKEEEEEEEIDEEEAYQDRDVPTE